MQEIEIFGKIQVSSKIYQGDDLFSVQSRGKQCAFMSLSALLTAHFIPLIDWSKTTYEETKCTLYLIRGDKMYLQALNDGFVTFVVLEPGVEFLYVGITLPKVVSVSSCTNMFS